MRYTNIIEEFTWSYSRITQYESCPYGFFLKYIRKTSPCRHFFSDYGSFMHRIIQKYLEKELTSEELATFYLTNFYQEVRERAPTIEIFQDYFTQGLEYSRDIKIPQGEVLGIEQNMIFDVEGIPFTSFVDLITQDNGVCVTDNKSRKLKQRSNRKKPTKSDKELDKYLRQLYLYSIPIEQQYGCFPKELIFNCFRSKELIVEPFNIEKFYETKNWALNTINDISLESEWRPDISWFKCKYLCDCNHKCEYWQMFN